MSLRSKGRILKIPGPRRFFFQLLRQTEQSYQSLRQRDVQVALTPFSLHVFRVTLPGCSAAVLYLFPVNKTLNPSSTHTARGWSKEKPVKHHDGQPSLGSRPPPRLFLYVADEKREKGLKYPLQVETNDSSSSFLLSASPVFDVCRLMHLSRRKSHASLSVSAVWLE